MEKMLKYFDDDISSNLLVKACFQIFLLRLRELSSLSSLLVPLLLQSIWKRLPIFLAKLPYSREGEHETRKQLITSSTQDFLALLLKVRKIKDLGSQNSRDLVIARDFKGFTEFYFTDFRCFAFLCNI